MIEQLLEGNRQFIADEFQPNAEYYKSLALKQTPKVLWIGCSDSRVSEHQMTGSKPGTMFVHRNVANIVAFNDVNISSILEYGVVHLKIEDIIVCGHTRCGGIAAIEDGVHENYIADWLCIASGAKVVTDKLAAERGLNREQKLELLTEENVEQWDRKRFQDLKDLPYALRIATYKKIKNLSLSGKPKIQPGEVNLLEPWLTVREGFPDSWRETERN
jgi:carbonic anhydrase